MVNRHGVGGAVGRREGRDKVTGKSVYAADMSLPGMLFGKLLRSPWAYARILNINTDKAERLSGVKAILHAQHFDSPYYGPGLKDMKVFPQDCVRYVGEPVAAIAAVSDEIAREALSLIEVEYEPLAPVFDARSAMEADAPLLHPDLDQYITIYPNPIKYGNVALYCKAAMGDTEKAFLDSDRVYEHTFTTPTTQAAPLETHAAIAQIEPGGGATIWATTQQPFLARNELAAIFGVPADSIRVIVPELGGGFGGKEFLLIEPYCYLLARETNLPVKMVLSREEEIQTSSPRHASHIELKTGVTKDGVFVAQQARVIYDTGAYSGQGPFVTACGLLSVYSSYRIDHRSVEAFCVYTNKPNACSYRGYGFPQGVFASEAQIDLIADDLKIDPLELRLKNAVRDGDLTITGQPLHGVGLSETIREAATKANWKQKREEAKSYRGIGIACAAKAGGIGASSAIVKVNADGSVTVSSGLVDVGAGSATLLAQVVSEELGLPLENIHVQMGDTSLASFDFGSVASRGAFCGAEAVRRASQDARQRILELAAGVLQAEIDELFLEGGLVHSKLVDEKKLPFAAIGGISHFAVGGPIVGVGSFIGGEGISLNPGVLEGFPLGVIPHYSFGTQIAEVEVDPLTGSVEVTRIVGVHDVGKALNPLNVIGQIEGGMVMGLSAGLFEQILFDDQGKIRNPNFVEFKMPTALDVPELISSYTEEPDPGGPYGAKGLGEVVVTPTAPAIANAVFNAIGIMIHDLPLTSEKILNQLELFDRPDLSGGDKATTKNG